MKPLSGLVKPGAKYLNFNYTEFAETLYQGSFGDGIPHLLFSALPLQTINVRKTIKEAFMFFYYLSAVFCCCLIIPAGVNHSIIKGSIHHSPFEAVFESRHFDADIPKGAEVIDVCKAVEEMMNESEERGELRMLIKNIINASYSRDLSTKIAAADHLKMCWQAMQNEP